MAVVRTILTIAEVVASLFLILVVLLQSGKSAGIAGAIGGPLDQVGRHRLYDHHAGAGAHPGQVILIICVYA